MSVSRRAPAGIGTWMTVLSLSAAVCVGCAQGGETTPEPGGSLPSDGGSGGASDASPDTTGGTGGTGGTAGKDAGPDSGGSGGQDDAGPDVSPDVDSDAGPDAAPETGPEGGGLLEVGELCTDNAECSSGFCADVGQAGAPLKACIRPCLPNIPCPDGTRCTSVPGMGHVCAPYHDEACGTCSSDVDCAIQTNKCLSGAGGQTYCAVDCSFDNGCPAGMECQTVGGGKLCVPQGGAACPCAPNRDGETRACENTVGGVVCTGTEACDGALGAFAGCTALTPGPETCNGLDDDCNGTVDDLPHAGCDCSGGPCSLVCAPGYAHYPNTVPETDGCPCVADPYDGSDGGSCATPHAVAAVVDSGANQSNTISGTLSSDTDEDWFTVTFTDVGEAGTNSFHANIGFTSNPNNEFVFVVVKACADAPAAPKLTQADNCVNYLSGGVGLAPCGNAAGVNHCAVQSMTRLVGVMRNPAATSKTCTSYELTVKAAGACDTAGLDSCTW